MPKGTVTLHRVICTPPEKIYRAFLNAQAITKWLPPYGFTCTVAQMDAQVGGQFKMAFQNFSTGSGHSFGGTYLELIPEQRIRYVERFDNPDLAGEMHVTIDIRRVVCGAEVSIVQEGIPESIPVAMCYLGWQESLDQLKHLVEPDIPG